MKTITCFVQYMNPSDGNVLIRVTIDNNAITFIYIYIIKRIFSSQIWIARKCMGLEGSRA